MVAAAAPLKVSPAVATAAHAGARKLSAEYRVVLRARITVDAMAGVSNEENARRNGVKPDTVRAVRRRAEAAGTGDAAFADAPRSGRPPWLPLEPRLVAVQKACDRPAPELSKARTRAREQKARRELEAARRKAKRFAVAGRRANRRAAAAKAEGKRHEEKRQRQAAKRAERDRQKALKTQSKAKDQLSGALADAAAVTAGRVVPFSAVWTLAALQSAVCEETGVKISRSELSRILRCTDLRPHRVRAWLHSPDPKFREKTKAICDLYLNAPPGTIVLCVDEKPGMTARADRYPLHVPESGGAVRREWEYVRHGTSTLIAAFNVETGKVFGRCRRRTKRGIRSFLDEVAKKYPEGQVVIVWDNLNVHKSDLVREFEAVQGGRFRFVNTPLHASWLNQVEVWFSILQRLLLKHSSFGSVEELEAAVMDFIRHWNRQARPFRWRFRGDFARPSSLAA